MVYAIAQLTITDRAAYGRYVERFMGVMKRFRGRVLASDERPQVIEGTWDREKVVVLEFPDEPGISRMGGIAGIQGDRERPSCGIGRGGSAGEGRWRVDTPNRWPERPIAMIANIAKD
jgi:hypothetical protein